MTLPGRSLAAASAVVLFVGMTSYRLDRTGLYYDELHQAVGAFAYVGRPTTMFSVLPIASKPLLNMPYSGAIKTAIYGLYLRTSGRPFSIVGWRMLGISFSAGGIAAFCLLGGRRLPLAALLLFLGLVLTDLNFLLQSRHDWGPVALAFLLRMLFIGLWLRWVDRPMSHGRFFVLGLIVGIAIFEKLSSAVLLGPLTVIVLGSLGTPSSRRIALAAGGVFVGAAPVIAANLYWYWSNGSVLALSSTSSSARTAVDYGSRYLALGNGGAMRRFMFPDVPVSWSEWLEALMMASLIALVGVVAWRRRRDERDRPARLAGMALMSYLAVGIGLSFLPAETNANHWIIGTPFQYLAIAFAAASLWSSSARETAVRMCLLVSLAALLVARTPALLSTFQAVQSDNYLPTWDPSINAAARFAAQQGEDAIFVAADWGVATQVFCMSNGRQDYVFEPFWDYRGPETLRRILDDRRRQLALVAAPKPRSPVLPVATGRIFDDLAADRDWIEVALDPSVQRLSAVELHAFRRAGASTAVGVHQ